MKDSVNELQIWLNKLTNFSLPDWKNLPDLDLYMDQVITYFERELAPLMVEDKEKMITSWMINNYVKGNLLPSPIQKKYTTEHLGYLFAICSVKQILSISDIAKLLNFQREEAKDPESLYQFFRNSQADMIHSMASDTLQEIEDFLNNNQSQDDKDTTAFLNNFVFKLAIEAEVKKIIADKILYLISKSNQEKKLEQERLEKERLAKEKEIKEQKEKEQKQHKEKETKEQKEIREIRDKKPAKNKSYLANA